MRATILLVGLTMLSQAANAVPYDRVTVRLGRIEPLLAVPSSAAPAQVQTPPRAVHRAERAA